MLCCLTIIFNKILPIEQTRLLNVMADCKFSNLGVTAMVPSINHVLQRLYTSQHILQAVLLFTISSACVASPFDKGNTKNGNFLHDENCRSCHDSMFPDGKGDDIYDEDARKIKSSKALYSMVEFCATNNGLGWFEEENIDVSKYLNQTFYKFKN